MSLSSASRARRMLKARDGVQCDLCRDDVFAAQKAIRAFRRDPVFRPALIECLVDLPWRVDSGRSLAEVDHRVPLAEGGAHHPDNLRLLCVLCHRAETAALRARLGGKK